MGAGVPAGASSARSGGSFSMPKSSAAAPGSALSPEDAASFRRAVGRWRSLFTIARAMASTLFRPFSSSLPPTCASVRSASARAISSARRRSAASTGRAARASRSAKKAIISASTMASARMASSARALFVWWTTRWRSSMSYAKTFSRSAQRGSTLRGTARSMKHAERCRRAFMVACRISGVTM